MLAPRLTALFEAALASGEASWFSLPGGAPLFLAGERADAVFLLRAGRLRVSRGGSGPDSTALGWIPPGEPVGEMAAIEGGAHGADAVAIRDCELWRLPSAFFLRVARDDPPLMAEIIALVVARLRRRGAPPRSLGPPAAASLGFVAAATRDPIRRLVERIALQARRLGCAVTVVGAETAAHTTEWFSSLAASGDLIFHVVEAGEDEWRRLSGRQVDRVFVVVDGEARPPASLASPLAPPRSGLIVRWRGARGAGAAAWADLLATQDVHHLGAQSDADAARMARVLTGRAVGLVLSGGSARALAHVGVVRALRRSGVPIDRVGGVSMGAVIALAVAMDWPQEEMEARIRAAFSDSSPLADIAFPFVALSRGGIVRRRLRRHFGEGDILDLALPFFCLSANLTTGLPMLYDRGVAREAVLASLSIPGVLPPVVRGGDILVDGAVLNNFPVEAMRERHEGPIIGVDVGKAAGISAADLMTSPAEITRWLLSGAWRRGPPIVSLLMRAATVSAGREVTASRSMTDLLIEPDVEAIEIRNWRAYGPAIAAGEAAAEAALRAQWPLGRRDRDEAAGTTP